LGLAPLNTLSDTLSMGLGMPRARGKVTIEVSRGLRDRIRELSQKRGVLYEDLLGEALDLYAVSKQGLLTQSNTQSRGPPAPIQVRKGDYMTWTIRVGEGWEAIEVDLNTIQLAKLCKARLLAIEVCERAREVG
jgi:hypothetical protein